jgi:hypothetical protein
MEIDFSKERSHQCLVTGILRLFERVFLSGSVRMIKRREIKRKRKVYWWEKERDWQRDKETEI